VRPPGLEWASATLNDKRVIPRRILAIVPVANRDRSAMAQVRSPMVHVTSRAVGGTRRTACFASIAKPLWGVPSLYQCQGV